MKTGRIQKEQQEIKNKHQFFHQQEPLVTVGIVSGERISFLLNASYVVDGLVASGEQTAKYVEGQILWKGCLYDSLLFKSDGLHASFSLKDVTIGINFHWERQETQTFAGDLRLIIDGNKIWAVNELPVEEYLKSVISSEMSADASLQLLKAHAVISRSWLLHAMQSRHEEKELTPQPFVDAENMLVRWYDRDDHKLFDVCADDHCQRYQGITRETNPRVAEAISETRGQVLMADGEVCNARFSKCCGGVLEEFQFCWDDSPKSYLVALADTTNEESIPDLTDNATAERWIRSVPDSFCNTTAKNILSQVLNDYDQETTDFYRWQVKYKADELSNLVSRKLQKDLGRIVDLVPIKRGRSGRIELLHIVGTKTSLTLGKELEIRRALSETHLYSSAFVVDKKDFDEDGLPLGFELIGAGWGHGVGLCQIGAAVMGEQGYAFDEILKHYYKGAEIVSLWV